MRELPSQKTPARLERSPADDGWCFGIRALGLEGCLVLAHGLHVGVFAALEGALLGELVAESLRWSMEIFQETCFELRDCCEWNIIENALGTSEN